MTTDNTQAAHMANSGKSPSYALGDAQAELDEILERAIAAGVNINLEWDGASEFNKKFGDALNEAKQAILDWHNKQIEAVLDRLEARLTEEASGIRQINTDYAYGFTAANDQTNEAIEAERNKLKESDQ